MEMTGVGKVAPGGGGGCGSGWCEAPGNAGGNDEGKEEGNGEVRYGL